jgi:hypothetical protein
MAVGTLSHTLTTIPFRVHETRLTTLHWSLQHMFWRQRDYSDGIRLVKVTSFCPEMSQGRSDQLVGGIPPPPHAIHP